MTHFTPVLHSVSYSGAWPGQALFDVEQFLYKAVELGFNSVALVSKRPHVSPLDYDIAARGRLRDQLRDLRLDLAALMGYTDFTAGLEHPGIPSAEMNALYVGDLAKLAADLGAPRLRIFTGYLRPGLSYDAQYAEVVKGLRLAAREAARYGITLVVQNHHDIGCHHDQFLWILEDVGELNVRAAFDAWAPYLQGLRGQALIDAVRKISPHLEFTTVADYQVQPRFHYDPTVINYVRDEPPLVRAVPPGRGDVDYHSFFEGLRLVNYRGPVAYEMCAPLQGGGGIDNLDAAAKHFLEFLKKMEEGKPALTGGHKI